MAGLGLGMLLMALLKSLRGRHQFDKLDSLDARRDPLTGLANRLALDEFLDKALRGPASGGPLGLLIVDIDHFKPINDTHGHRAGDLVLEGVGKTLRAATHRAGIIARLGGDEFAIVYSEGLSRELSRAAEKVRTFIEGAAFSIGKGEPEIGLTVSIGVSLSRDGDTRGTVLDRADQAMYHAKRTGRNRVCFADADSTVDLPTASVSPTAVKHT